MKLTTENERKAGYNKGVALSRVTYNPNSDCNETQTSL